MDATASTQAAWTAESGSRRRRSTVEIIRETCGDRASPWAEERTLMRRTHWRRTGDFSDESVAERQFRKGAKASFWSVLAMASSSLAAIESVSLSESLSIQLLTRDFNSPDACFVIAIL